MNPPPPQNNSHSVRIFCEGTGQYSFVSHLSTALHREGISFSVDACEFPEINSFSGDQNHSISVVVTSEVVKVNDPWSHKFVEVIERPRDKGMQVMVPVFYDVDPLTRVYGWANRWLEAGYITMHQSRFKYFYIYHILCICTLGALKTFIQFPNYKILVEIFKLFLYYS